MDARGFLEMDTEQPKRFLVIKFLLNVFKFEFAIGFKETVL